MSCLLPNNDFGNRIPFTDIREKFRATDFGSTTTKNQSDEAQRCPHREPKEDPRASYASNHLFLFYYFVFLLIRSLGIRWPKQYLHYLVLYLHPQREALLLIHDLVTV
jgi:hypothetical protein